MRFNQNGADLVKKFEGRELKAYKDPVGIWTIGYGHTSMAGPPHVKPGMRISAKQANDLLLSDMRKYSDGIRRLIKVKLNDNQFSALSSFAYNVGVGAFKRSSVLRAVNAKRFDLVPSKLNLWVKAGGKTLRGLVRRRQAEGELFMRDHQYDVSNLTGVTVETIEGKSPFKSTTNIATITGAATSLGVVTDQLNNAKTVVAGAKDDIMGLGLDVKSLLLIGAAILIVGCAVWIINERYNKSKHEGI